MSGRRDFFACWEESDFFLYQGGYSTEIFGCNVKLKKGILHYNPQDFLKWPEDMLKSMCQSDTKPGIDHALRKSGLFRLDTITIRAPFSSKLKL